MENKTNISKNDSSVIRPLSATEFDVTLVRQGVTVHFLAVCDDPHHGKGNGFDISIQKVSDKSGGNLIPFLEAMDLMEFLDYEAIDFCFHFIYVDIEQVERQRMADTMESMEMIRQSYLG